MKKTKIKIWIDEAGRGPWAGPVVACALAWNPNNMPKNDILLSVKDSKKLSEKKREELYSCLINLSCPQSSLPEDEACPKLFFWVWVVDNFFIDERNIRQANKEAMRRAIVEIYSKIPKEFSEVSVVIDGRDNYEFSELTQKPLYIIWWDGKVSEISAASIIAKVFRDKLMCQYATLYPHFGFDHHAGYGTKKHKEVLESQGVVGIHRKSYKPVKKVVEAKEKVLVHICCWPDATVPLMDLKKDYEVIAYWYDPNIQPVSEHEKRFDAFVRVCEIEGVKYIRWEYDVKNFFHKIRGLEHTPERGEKCRECYDMRLERTALLAREMWITKWTSSLNNSPHKDMEKMFTLGEKWETVSTKTQTISDNERCQASKILGISVTQMLDQAQDREKNQTETSLKKHLEFLKIAFRKSGGFQRSVDYTNEHNIYRQNYCGCVYSDTFPWREKKKVKNKF